MSDKNTTMQNAIAGSASQLDADVGQHIGGIEADSVAKESQAELLRSLGNRDEDASVKLPPVSQQPGVEPDSAGEGHRDFNNAPTLPVLSSAPSTTLGVSRVVASPILSSIATEEGDSQIRPLDRSGPANPTRTTRSSSFGSSSRSVQRLHSATGMYIPVAGPSTSSASLDRRDQRARVDASEHWLSEDEGTVQVNDYLQDQRRRVARGELGSSSPPRSNRDSDDDLAPHAPRKNRTNASDKPNSATQVATNAPALMSTGPVQLDDNVIPFEALPKTSHLLQMLKVLLLCPICQDPLNLPITLGCGHSICHACSMADISTSSPASITSASLTRTPSSNSDPLPSRSVARSHFQAIRRRFSAGLPQLDETSQFSQRSDLRSTPVTPFYPCPHIECKRSATKWLTPPPPPATRSGLQQPSSPTGGTKPAPFRRRSDVLLMKLVHMLNRLDVYRLNIGELPDSKTMEEVVEETESASPAEIPRAGSPPQRTSSHGSTDSAGSSPADEVESDGKRGRKNKNGKDARKSRRIAVELPQQTASEQEVEQEVNDFEDEDRSLARTVLSELDCQVCANVYAEPITTPCGHTFCRKCLARSLDHSDKCPLCRGDLPAYYYFTDHPNNKAVTAVLEQCFGSIYFDRLETLRKEEELLHMDLPIFVCALAFPDTPTFLHIFEPRYRLMMRRVMDKNKHFGMVLPSQAPGGLYLYGTVLEIKSIEVLPDGRSMVETVGIRRFKLLKTGTLDGYVVAQIEPIHDIDDENEKELEDLAISRAKELRVERAAKIARGEEPGEEVPEELSTEQLMGRCHEFLDVLRTGAAPWLRQKLNDTLGPMPDNPAEFSYYMAAVIPIYEYEKAKLLPITSPRLRLKLLVFWIEQLRGSWWFNRGCTIS